MIYRLRRVASLGIPAGVGVSSNELMVERNIRGMKGHSIYILGNHRIGFGESLWLN